MNGRLRASGFCQFLFLSAKSQNDIRQANAMALVLDVCVDGLWDLARALQLVRWTSSMSIGIAHNLPSRLQTKHGVAPFTRGYTFRRESFVYCLPVGASIA